MRKFSVLLVFLVLFGSFAGLASASRDYKEVQESSYIVHWDGSANVTFRTILYGPDDMLNKTKESIIRMGVENATNLFVTQKEQSLKGLGLTLENATGRIVGYNTSGPLETVVEGRIANLAKYYSYDGVWEITLDALRIADLSSINPAVVNGSIYLENYFTVVLPEGASVRNVTKGFKVESSGSYITLETKRNGRNITVHSIIYFKKGVSRSDLKTLYSQLQPVIISYTGRSGTEEYSTWKMRTETNITIGANRTIVDTLEVYEEPKSYISNIKMQLLLRGPQEAERSIYQNRLREYQLKGIKVLDGSVKIMNLNSTGPLEIKYHWVLQGLIENDNTSYVYTYDPRLGLGNLTFPHRLTVAINETKVTRIILPRGYEFTSLPGDVNVKEKGGSITMRIRRVSEREITIFNSVYLPYGVLAKDYREVMAKVPENVEFRYSASGNGSGICGPAALLLLAILPLLWRKR